MFRTPHDESPENTVKYRMKDDYDFLVRLIILLKCQKKKQVQEAIYLSAKAARKVRVAVADKNIAALEYMASQLKEMLASTYRPSAYTPILAQVEWGIEKNARFYFFSKKEKNNGYSTITLENMDLTEEISITSERKKKNKQKKSHTSEDKQKDELCSSSDSSSHVNATTEDKGNKSSSGKKKKKKVKKGKKKKKSDAEKSNQSPEPAKQRDNQPERESRGIEHQKEAKIWTIKFDEDSKLAITQYPSEKSFRASMFSALICRLLGRKGYAFRRNKKIFMASNYYEGKTLDTFQTVDQKKVLVDIDIKIRVGYAIDILHDLAKMHRQGIIHRNIKLENVIISNDRSTAKITGFDDATLLSQKQKAILSTLPYLELSLAKRVVKNLYDKVEEKKLYDEKSDLYALRFVLAALFPELYSIVGTPIDFCTPAGELHGSYQAKELEQHETFGNENAKLIAFINSLNADNVDKRPKSAPQALKRLMKIANLDYGAEYQIANVRPLLRTHVESVIKNLNTIKNEDNSYGRVCKNTHAENVITKSKAKTYQHNSNYKTYLESLHKLILSVKDKTGLFSFLDFAKSKKTPVLKALANKCDQMLKEPESISIEDMHNISKTFFHIAMQRRNFGFSKITTTAEKIVNLFNTPEYEDLKELLFSSFRRKGSDISYYHLTRFVCGPTADIGIFRASNAALLFQNCRPLNNSEEKINFDFYQKLNVGIA